MNLTEALSYGRKRLSAVGVDSPSLDAEVILAHVLGVRRIDLFIHPERRLSAEEIRTYRALVEKRCSRVPVAYITGHKEFFTLDFQVKEGVLIPRPETEFLVEEVLLRISGVAGPKVAELCCGSGAVAVSVAFFNKSAVVYASDISETAGEVTLMNAAKYGVEDRVRFLKGDLWEPFEAEGLRGFDVVAANPPYIPSGEIENLPRDVKYEPEVALDGGPDGLEFFRRIIAGVPRFLKPGGSIVLEFGKDQAGQIADLLRREGFGGIKILKDYAGFERVIAASLHVGDGSVE
ncbi:peptide chain release factor N(5)-glutamine methyltransferase [Thermosediminibacter litoriperuensis]|uniref:Release factor glutamine methyltransferase n=1 Tax=Thermosediminibacter litoriperuensis TaxID=291989 RepID=A0A5S5B0K9_9FIRM|nr:peptide chain release factor N(5)-glutamine methyltransferase [Thermosediminibacter litoriperuensis]TYP58756.1 release factor glutamine methyltransferase [Thermosediminibacter litoriperuensis]